MGAHGSTCVREAFVASRRGTSTCPLPPSARNPAPAHTRACILISLPTRTAYAVAVNRKLFLPPCFTNLPPVIPPAVPSRFQKAQVAGLPDLRQAMRVLCRPLKDHVSPLGCWRPTRDRGEGGAERGGQDARYPPTDTNLQRTPTMIDPLLLPQQFRVWRMMFR